jgi:hypothetical protein
MMIPELFEMVVRSSTTGTGLHAAWNVSHTWRDTIRHILRTPDSPVSFFKPSKTPAAALGDTLQSGPVASILEPSAHEFEAFLHSLSVIRQTYDDCLVQHDEEPAFDLVPRPLTDSPGFSPPFIPARLLALANLPVSLTHEVTLSDFVGPRKEKWKISRLYLVLTESASGIVSLWQDQIQPGHV